MVARAKLVQELAKLNHADWIAVIEAASQQRREQLKTEADEEEPQPGISRDLFARWLARRQRAATCGKGVGCTALWRRTPHPYRWRYRQSAQLQSERWAWRSPG